ncbi:MAG: bifunctional diaminohydroxyphosphoribosylaminopyrimidine deaminase/5-amino-6-(5-phosphoribosylamino)uracil reductase RibD [Luteolibacter sp.]
MGDAETDDFGFMREALALARRGLGRTAPNPPVGAVVVADKKIIGRGWHRAAGMPHAEREALADAAATHGHRSLIGATVYISLEPCSTHGRTPPCTRGLIEAGVRRVVYACADPNPNHAGRADSELIAAGIEVDSGILRSEAEILLRPFSKVQNTGLPWVIWKSAMSLDGRLTRPPGEGQWLSSSASRADVQVLRSQVDAILTSGATVRKDRPSLTIREPSLLVGRQQPWRVVFTDHPESLPADCPLMCDDYRHRTLVRPGTDLAESLRRLVQEQGVLSCMTEAGGIFSAALFEADLVDEVVVYHAPLICGGPTPALAGNGLPQSLSLGDAEFERIGSDIRTRAVVLR